MNVVSECAFRVASLGWRRSSGEPATTIVCKGTYVLTPLESPLASTQDDPNEEDNYWNDDPARSLYAACDLVPFKARPEVVLVGSAFSTQERRVRDLVARLIVGCVDKAVEVHGDRSWTLDGAMREGAGFTKMPLQYERAAGGAGTSNPAGMRFDVRDARGTIAIPAIQPPGLLVSQPGEVFAPIGFGPIAPTWPTRMERLHRHAGTWSHRDWHARPLPPDFDPGYFNVAPRDQQLDMLRPDERITLEGLHPEHERLTTSLPGHAPRVYVERAGGVSEELPLQCDTLWIDTDRGVCTLVWRGTLSAGRGAPVSRVVVSSYARSPRDGEREDGTGTIISGFETDHHTLPFAPTGDEAEPRSPLRAATPDGALPFATTGAANTSEHVLAAHAVVPGGRVPRAPVYAGAAEPPRAALLPLPEPPPPLLAMVAPAPAPRSAWSGADANGVTSRQSLGQQMITDRQTVGEKASVQGSPRGAPENLGPIVPVARTAQDAPLSAVDEAAAKRGWKPARAGGGVSPPLTDLARGGAFAASNSAADAARSTDPLGAKAAAIRPTFTPAEVIELLWHDPTFMSRIRRQPAWKDILAQVRSRPLDDDIAADAPPEKRQEMRDRRDVFFLLARADATDMRGIEEALASAVNEDGMFVPPLVVVGGPLTLPFDKIEELKATIAAVTPLIAGDKKLQETVDTAQVLLKTPWLGGAAELAEGVTSKIKDAFVQGNRALPPRYLEQHTERMLLHQRAYQKRTVLGKASLRGLLLVRGASEGVPVYLPEALGEELPLFTQFEVKMLVEARAKVDQYETHGVAMKGVAVGRLVMTPRRA